MADTTRMSRYRWELPRTDKSLEACFIKHFGINTITAQTLLNRGITDITSAESFLNTSLENIYNPFFMKDMEKAVKRIVAAIVKREKIVIFGDYDVDGITATALLITFFRELGIDIQFFIPVRLKEGYGLNKEAINKINSAGGNLIITVDCGISSYDEVELANKLGMDVIITDHHQLPDKLPRSFAIINVFQNECRYPFKYLSGVGIAYKLIMALRSYLRKNGLFVNSLPNIKRHLDLFAIGSIADIVPLLDENRILVKHGLIEISNTNKYGIKALKQIAAVDGKRLNTYDVGFYLAPRLNSAGRIDDASICVDLLVCSHMNKAVNIAKQLDVTNRERQRLQERIYLDALSVLNNNLEFINNKAIIMSSKEWHPGVLGIVAGKLVDRFYLPTILVSIDNKIGKASCRSVHEFNIYESLKACAELLERFGGHQYAAGFTIREEVFEEFKRRFIELASSLTEEELSPIIKVDAEVLPDDIDLQLASEFDLLGPFGNSNPEPILYCKNVQPRDITFIGKRNEHIRFKIRRTDGVIECVGFNMAYLKRGYDTYKLHDILFTPELNYWNGNKYLRLKIKDSRQSIIA